MKTLSRFYMVVGWNLSSALRSPEKELGTSKKKFYNPTEKKQRGEKMEESMVSGAPKKGGGQSKQL